MANTARIDDLKKKFDENPRRYFAPLANEYRKAGDPDQAIAICREFLPQQPGHMSGHIVYGQALYDAQQLDEAKLVFDTALTLDPENLIALRYLGDIARGLGDVASARLWYQRVLDADPRNDEIAALLTELVDTRQAMPSESPLTGPTGTVVMPSVSLEGLTGSAPPETEAAEPPVEVPAAEPVEATLDAVGGPAPEVAAPEAVATSEAAVLATEPPPVPPVTPVESVEAVTAGAPEEPPEASAPPAEELLDLDDLDLAVADSSEPWADTLRPSLETTGFAVERAGDGLLMPTVDAAGESPPEDTSSEPDSEREALGDEFPPVELDLATPVPTPPSAPTIDPFATETMAELYRSQGHHDEALRVYRQLLAQRPDDAGLQAKVAELESAVLAEQSTTPPAQEVPDLDTSSFTFESGSQGGEAQLAARADSGASDAHDLVIEPPPGLVTGEQPGGPVLEGAPEPEPEGQEASAESESHPVQEAEAQPASGPSIREFLVALGNHVLGGGGGGGESAVGPEPADADEQGRDDARGGGDQLEVHEFFVEETVAVVESDPVDSSQTVESEWGESDVGEMELAVETQGAAAEPAEGTSGVAESGAEPREPEHASSGGTIDLMFDPASVSDEDQAAAEGLAGAYGATPEAIEPPPTPMEGAPARRATEELSLDSVFRDQRSPASLSEPRGFSFDKFFANPTPAMGSSIMETPPLGQPSESADDDIEQFNSWLDGLKKR